MEAERQTSDATIIQHDFAHSETGKDASITATVAVGSPESPAIPPEAHVSSSAIDVPHLPDPMQQKWQKRQIHRWKSPLLMLVLFMVGLAMSLAHCIFYPKLKGKIVGGPDEQEEKIRYGTAFSFLAQISLTASVWTVYTQWLWRTVKNEEMTVNAINHAFGADTSVLWLLNLEMLKKLRVGSIIAAFAWSLLLPPFFTPATLFIYPSTDIQEITASMPYPNIFNSSEGHKYAFSPPQQRGTTQYVNDTSRQFTGPRTILTLIATATASPGEILDVKLPYNNSAHSIDFFAPIVKCGDANASATALISHSLQQEMAEADGTNVETYNVYYGFVPTWNASGAFIPLSAPRQQYPSNASNELWMTFFRPTVNDSGVFEERHYQVCVLHNATYHLRIDRDHGFQNITGSYEISEVVPFPRDSSSSVSNMAQHAYTAFMTTLCDQLVGKFSWYNNTAFNSSSVSPSGVPQFGALEAQLLRTSILGSLDLDAFFKLDEARNLYRAPEGNGSMSDQRLMDKGLARNRTLDVLIEELSFNTSVSLMWNPLLTYSKPVAVNLTNPVNRYDYKQYGLYIPYALANLFTLVVIIIGLYSYINDGVYPDKKAQDILAAVGDPEIMHVVKDRRRSVTAIRNEKGELVWKAGTRTESMQQEALKKIKTFLAGIWRWRRKDVAQKERVRHASSAKTDRH